MTGLMTSLRTWDCARNWPMDQSAQSGSFSSMSTRTLVSTRSMPASWPSAAQQRHQVLGAPLHVGLAPGRLEAIRGNPRCLGAATGASLLQHHLAVAVDGEVDGRAGREPQGVADLLWDGDLPLDGEGGRHEALPLNGLTDSIRVIPDNRGSKRKYPA